MNIEHIKSVKSIIVHGPDCPDGRAAALILHDALPDADIRFVQYGTPEHRALEPKPGMLFCDFTPFVERDKSGAMTDEGRAKLKAWVDAGTIVLDHHKGAADVVEAFGERGVFADETKEPGVSGATLAYREVWLPDALLETTCSPRMMAGVKRFAELAGIRDTWVKSSPHWNEACAQAAALMFWPWPKLLHAGVHGVAPLLDIGPGLLERDAARDQKTIGEAHGFEVAYRAPYSPDIDRLRVVCFEGTRTSDMADKVEADLIIGWKYLCEGPPEARQQKIIFSTRSRGGFSCLDFAKANGGNGHKNAAGFSLLLTTAGGGAHESPYALVERLVQSFLLNR